MFTNACPGFYTRLAFLGIQRVSRRDRKPSQEGGSLSLMEYTNRPELMSMSTDEPLTELTQLMSFHE